MNWVNRIGILLEFLSFWFAAPEILGEKRLRVLEQRVEQGIKVLPALRRVLLGLTAGLALLCVLWSLVEASGLSQGCILHVAMGWVLGGLLGMVWEEVTILPLAKAVSSTRLMMTALALILFAWSSIQAKAWALVGLAAPAVLVFVFEVALLLRRRSGAMIRVMMALVMMAWVVAWAWTARKVVTTWWGEILVAVATAAIVTEPLEVLRREIGPLLLRTLADDTHIRQRSLAVGAVLFVLGFLLQLTATF